MKNPQYSESQLFEAFIRLAQYCVRLKTQQDVGDHLGKFVTAYFPADWVVFVRRDSMNGISIYYCTRPDAAAAQRILTEEARALIADVLESGFLASQVIPTPAPSMTVFLPIVEEYRTEYVMLIGHKTAEPLPNELLNIYLAIAGLAGTTFERLHSERELNRHRSHLEELVKGRTAELAKAKRQNELILHSVGEGICGVDPEGRITFVNPFAAQMIGWDPAELIGRNAHATFHHTQANGCPYPTEKCPVHSVLANGGTKYAADEEFLRKDGTRFPVEFTIAPIVEGDNIIGAVIVFRDITERKRAEEALREGEARRKVAETIETERRRLFDVLETLPAMICLLTPDYHVAFANRSFREKFGESRGRRCYEYCFGRSEPCEFCESYTVLKTGRPHRWEVNSPDGSVIDAYDFPFTDVDGSPMILEMDIDITARKQAEAALQNLNETLERRVADRTAELQEKQEELEVQAEELEVQNEEISENNAELEALSRSLRESEEKFLKAFYANPAAMTLSDEDGRYIDVNESYSKLTGYSRDELIGHTSAELNIIDAERRKTYLGEFQEKGSLQDIDFEIQTKSGEKRIIISNSESFELGSKVRFISFIYDITRRKKAEKELIEAKEQVELYLDLMGHDIANMHQIAMGQLELAQDIMAEEGMLDGEYKEMINISLETLERSARLIDNVRKLQKLRAGTYGTENVDLGALLFDVVDENSKISDKNIIFNYVPAQGNLVRANPLLKDVFTNLVSNAVKHSNGPANITISVRKTDENGSSYYHIAIEDDGPGIPDDKKAEIFHRFKRGDSKARGTGLGLYIVKTLTESFNGHVRLEDRVPGDHTKGSRFIVCLPAVEKLK